MNKKKLPTYTKRKLINALNKLDEFACMATEGNDNGEAQEQEKIYNYLFDFITTQYGNKNK